jgi:hypothetical protein
MTITLLPAVWQMCLTQQATKITGYNQIPLQQIYDIIAQEPTSQDKPTSNKIQFFAEAYPFLLLRQPKIHIHHFIPFVQVLLA